MLQAAQLGVAPAEAVTALRDAVQGNTEVKDQQGDQTSRRARPDRRTRPRRPARPGARCR